MSDVLIGTRRGKLLVVGEHLARLKCVCDCGSEVIISSKHFNRRTTCGKCNPKKYIINVGDKFGLWTTIKPAPEGPQGKARWEIICECGRLSVLDGCRLANGSAKGCITCIKRMQAALDTDNYGVNWRIKMVRRNIVGNAVKRNIPFELTDDELKSLVFSNCYYCESEPSNTFTMVRTDVQFKYNGIDRIDSSKGYTIDNVKTACKTCNLGKHIMSESDFYQWAERVVQTAISRGALTRR